MSKTTKKIITDIADGKWSRAHSAESLLNKAITHESEGLNDAEAETLKTIRKATLQVMDEFEKFDVVYCNMITREADVSERVKAHASFLKDKCGQIVDALARIEKLAGHDFELKLQRLERFSVAVETLSKLNQSGKLGGLAKALSEL